MSSSIHVNNKKKIPGKGPIQGLDRTALIA